jgi:hypothetical protein
MVTGTNMFARSIGSAVGVAVFGAIVNANATVGADGIPHGPQLQLALHLVFDAIAIVAVALLIAVVLMPGRRAEQAAVNESSMGTPSSATPAPQ